MLDFYLQSEVFRITKRFQTGQFFFQMTSIARYFCAELYTVASKLRAIFSNKFERLSLVAPFQISSTYRKAFTATLVDGKLLDLTVKMTILFES